MSQISSTAVTSDQLNYTFTFDQHEHQAISTCLDEHGFAVVRQSISQAFVQELCEAVVSASDPFGTLEHGQTRVRHAFCDFAPCILKLLDNEPWMALQRHLMGSDKLTVHRCASILKNIGSPPVTWHTDWGGYQTGEPKNSTEVLNVGEHLSGAWFYLDGTHPSRAGLAIIPGSHRIDWECPQGFEFTQGRSSFYPKGEQVRQYEHLDVPGAVALLTDPGDMILFAARTYHYATAHNGKEARRSCALGFRADQNPFPVPWLTPESARCLKRCVPERYKPYLEHYPSFVSWTSDAK